ncbi:Adenine deaminase (EC [Olavius algarvensis Delta 1 endosymbiont]|nr:Adenine deaminase (EC [Olavius algarvensis Delta 1 endosymbiont]
MAYHHKQSVDNSLGRNHADLILQGGKIVDVHSGLIKEGDIIVTGHRIVGLYDHSPVFAGANTEIMDVSGKYVLPGFIEPHIHIESSMLTLTNFSRVVLPRGTTTVINDPHEIANVMGVRGVRQMMDEGHYTNLRFYFTIPSCVPSLSEEFETCGASFSVEAIKSLLEEKSAIGLGEMMNYPGVIAARLDVLAKIYETYRMRGFKKKPPIIDGHCPGLAGPELSAYINAGIMADHECSTGEELEERLAKGMFVMVRNGSYARNARELLEYVIEKGIDTRRLMLCADDRNPFDLLNKGHIDQTLAMAVRVAKESGWKIKPVEIIRMATLNPAQFFHMPYRGRLGIGTRADITVVEDLEDFNVFATLRDGKLVAREGQIVNDVQDYPYHENILNSVKIARRFSATDFQIKSNAKQRKARVIEMVPGQLLTKQKIETLKAKNGFLESDIERDILKIVVIERHRQNNNFSIGYVNGFGIKKGAVALTIGHDSHNLAVIGKCDNDIAFAVNELVKMQGGVVVSQDGNVLASLPLRIGGLMSTEDPQQVVQDKMEVYEAYKALGGPLTDPIIAMSFLQLPVIPELKITDKSLVEMTAKGPRKVPLLVD